MADENNHDWLSQLPEDLRLHPSVLKVKGDPITLAKNYVELEKKMGARVELPDLDKAKPEEIDALYERLGRPKEFKDYEYPKELPDGMSIPEEFGNSVKSIAHKMGLNKKQFQMLTNWGIEQSVGMLNEQTKDRETAQGKLKAEWGFRYNDNVEKAHKTLAMLVNMNDKHPFLAYLEQSKLGDSPEFLKFLLELGDRFSEDKLVSSEHTTEQLNKENALKKINEIRADKKHPYWDENNPSHKDAIKEMNSLYETAYPG